MTSQMKSNQCWIFNTDETEEVGVGKHELMLEKQVIAAHGNCFGLGAELTLNKPDAGDTVFYYRAGFGFVACATVTDQYAEPTAVIFGAEREFYRPVINVKRLGEGDYITPAEVKVATGQTTSYRHIVCLIHGAQFADYLLNRFNKTRPEPPITSKSCGVVKAGAGFQPNPELRVKVEKAAIGYVTKYYEEKGWAVTSVEGRKVGYDLHCTKKTQVKCVEVKGVSGSKEEFILTANELRKAHSDKDFVLFLVVDALTNPNGKKYTNEKLLSSFSFAPISYRVKRLK